MTCEIELYSFFIRSLWDEVICRPNSENLDNIIFTYEELNSFQNKYIYNNFIIL